MEQQQFSLSGGGLLAFTPDAADRLITLRNGAAALLYIYLLKHNGCVCDETAETLAMTRTELQTALQALRQTGLLGDAGVPVRPSALVSEDRPVYSAGQVAALMKEDRSFRDLVTQTQRQLGKTLSPHDLQLLYGIYDWRGFQPGALSLLMAYCVADARKKYGESKPPTMKQIDREAAAWERAGATTEELAMRHMAALEHKGKRKSEIRRMLQTDTNRRPSPTEERCLDSWAAMDMELDTVLLAYDRTVRRTGGLNFSYMDAILQDWHKKGLSTVTQVESQDKKAEKKPKSAAKRKSLGEAERQALASVKQWEEDGHDGA